MKQRLPKLVSSYFIWGLTGLFAISFTAFLPQAIVSNTQSGLQAEAIAPFLNGNLPASGASGDISLESMWGGVSFSSPMALAFHPNQAAVFVAQRNGQIFTVNTDNYEKTLALDLSGNVSVCVDGGFMGMVMHPDAGLSGEANKPYLYVYYSTRDSLGGHEPTSLVHVACWRPPLWYGSYLVLSRWEFDPLSLQILPNSELVMIRRRLFNSVHRGGGLAFGNDGFLYLTTGDQGIQRPSQELDDNLDGAVIRIDVDRDPSRSHAPTYVFPKREHAPDEISGIGYFIPNTNPFNGDSATFEEYYALGFRNPHRISSDPVSGRLYVGDVGSWKREEINVLTAGGNYGWPVYEGKADTNNYCINWLYRDSVQQLPLAAFPRQDANSITGGYVYRGTNVPSLYGKYICGDYGNGKELFEVDPISGEYKMLPISSPRPPIGFGQDARGEVYILAFGAGPIYRLASSSNQFDPPATLSATGAFSDLTTLEPTPGLIPYSLNVPFWSDDAEKYRWMAIPNDGDFDSQEEYILFSKEDPWKFPKGTVFIKHFEWQQKRIETRFFVQGTHQQWYGLSYRWRTDQSEADLVEVGQLDTLDIAPGVQKPWYFPARNECLTCHDIAAGSVLGPGTSQLNGSLLYAGGSEPSNQLEALNGIGIFDTLLDPDLISKLPISAPSSDPAYSLESRARAYLDANCAYCHQPSTGNRADFDLRLHSKSPAHDILWADVNENLGLDSAYAIKPGNPYRSIALHRMLSTTPGIAMPPLAKNEVDSVGARLIEDWILSLRKETPPNLNPPYIQVFPNPARETPYVQLNNFRTGPKRIRISDLQGKIVWEGLVTTEESEELFPMLTDLDERPVPGIYFVQVLSHQTVYTKRLMIR